MKQHVQSTFKTAEVDQHSGNSFFNNHNPILITKNNQTRG